MLALTLPLFHYTSRVGDLLVLVAILHATSVVDGEAPIAVPSHFYPYGPAAGDEDLSPCDDCYTDEIDLPVDIVFFGTSYDALYLSTNGLITFLDGYSSYESEPFPLDEGIPMITAFWADIDFSDSDGVDEQDVFYRLAQDADTLARATSDVLERFGDVVPGFVATLVVTSTFHRVTYYDYDGLDPTVDGENTFQENIITNGINSFAVFNYGKLTWISDGDSPAAQIGFDGGNGEHFYTVPGSQSPRILDIQGYTLFFRIDLQTITANPAINIVNECEFPELNECDFPETCEDTLYSYTCGCVWGYVLHADGRNCLDLDECSTRYTNRCSHHCRNIRGSYECYCDDGYTIGSNGYTCKDINECNDAAINTCAVYCLNTPGSYRCACREGYDIAQDGVTCADINECSPRYSHLNMCSDTETCINTMGGHRCVCRDGYVWIPTNGTCVDVDECDPVNWRWNLCSHNDSCTNTAGSYMCHCPAGYQLHQDGRNCFECEEPYYGVQCNSTCNCTHMEPHCDHVIGCTASDPDDTALHAAHPLAGLVAATCALILVLQRVLQC